MLNLRNLVWLILIFFLVSCSSVATSTQQNSLTEITERIPVPSLTLPEDNVVITSPSEISITPPPLPTKRLTTPTLSPINRTQTLIPTPFKPSPTLIATILPTVTSSPSIPDNAHLNMNCLDILPNLPANEKLNGVLVLAPPSEASMESAYFYNLETGNKNPIQHKENERIRHFSVSPNGQWLAYEKDILDQTEHVTNSYLVVTDYSGSEQEIITLQASEWQYGWRGYWLDDQHLIIGQSQEPNPMGTSRVVNPSTGEEQTLQDWPKYPNISLSHAYDMRFSWNVAIIYDSSLRWVVYPAESSKDINSKPSLVLWDRQVQKVVANILLIPYPLDRPKWSPNGSQFAFSKSIIDHRGPPNRYELFSVDQDGLLSQLTQLTNFYNNVFIDQFSWSPDGHKIGFWMIVDGFNDKIFAILNLDTQQVTNYCVPGDSLIWSPNGQQVIVRSFIKDSNQWQILLVNIEHNYAAVIMDDKLLPVGWMVSP
jgi:Tol biopolymer transport system component